LVRDLKQLTEGGYRVQTVELFDMCPQTEQVETLTILEW
jgi:tRNA/tmRNA/rRNA uracil-C5-methylase (TrmA/RlmC/RlmD family)